VGSLPIPPTKTGFGFQGWYTGQNGGGNAFAASTQVAASITVYAKWIPAYTVSFQGNGSTGGSVPPTVSFSPGATVHILGNTGGLTRVDFNFSGWYMEPTGNGTNYAGQTLPVNADMVFYAHWEPVRYAKVTYFGNGNTAGTPPRSLPTHTRPS
jgi:uncharacterized repeat protein (TIGR02543 family)